MAAVTTASALPPGQQQQQPVHYLKSASSASSGSASLHPKSHSAPNQLPIHQFQQRQQQQHQFQPHQPTDALLHQHQASASSDGSSSVAGADQDQPLSVRIQQLPTPRTSISSGASSPPETLSPNAHPLSPTQPRHPHPQQFLQTSSTSSSTHSTSHHYTGHSSSSTPPSVRPDFQSTLASNSNLPNHTSSGSGIHVGVSNNAPYTRSPLAYQTQPFRSSSPAQGPKLAPSLFEPSSSSSPMAGSSIYNVNGSVGASTTATAASTSSTTMGGRVLFQAQQSEYEQQHQEQLLRQDERDMQKKSARSAAASSFLPPALTKVVQSAMDAVNVPTSPNSSHSRSTLPSSRMSTIPEATGPSVSAFAPRSSLRLALTPSSIFSLIAKLYKAAQLPLICLSWYFSSAVTNNLGKQILNQFSYPVTLTFVQFWFMAVFCFIAGAVFKMAKIRSPSRAIVQLTAPLVGFQVIGHVFSSVAISRVPLSVVHTVKVTFFFFSSFFSLRFQIIFTRAKDCSGLQHLLLKCLRREKKRVN